MAVADDRGPLVHSAPRETPPMIVEKRRIEDSTLLNVEGVIKLGESAQFFAQALERALEEDEGNVLVDFSRINYIDSTGIGELVGYLGRFRDRNRKLILINPSDRIRKLLAIAQLDRLFTIYDSLETALHSEK
jgi:anti-sigma B factor antagonist